MNPLWLVPLGVAAAGGMLLAVVTWRLTRLVAELRQALPGRPPDRLRWARAGRFRRAP